MGTGGGGCDGLGGRGHGVVRGLVCRDRAGHWGGEGCDGLGGEGAWGCERFGMQGQGWALGGGGGVVMGWGGGGMGL